MAITIPLPRMLFWGLDGQPLGDGAQLYTYVAGTSTPKPTYTDQSGGSTNPNPLDLDGADANAIWFSGAYKIDVKDADGVSLPGYPVDNVYAYDALDWTGLTATIAMLNATDTSCLSKSTNYSIGLTDRGKTILADATSASFTISLPAAASATNGFEITIKKTNTANLVTLDGNGTETIEGRLTFLLYDQNDVVTLLCDGSNWRVKSAVIRGNTKYQSTAFSVAIDDINQTFVCTATVDYAATLLSAVTAGDGFKVNFKKTSDTFNVTVTPAGMETIDGAANYILSSPWEGVSLISDGSNWLIQGEHGQAGMETGDIVFSVRSSASAGWILLNDGTIGDGSSGATTRANADTLDLFTFLWNNIADAWCPVSSGRGVSAAADFAAHKTIRLPLTRGRALGVAGAGVVALNFTADPATDLLTMQSNNSFYTGAAFLVTTTGSLPAPLALATTYYAIWQSATTIKVATTYINAISGVAVDITTTGTGVQTATIPLTSRALGEYLGEETHGSTIAEIPEHAHSYGIPVTVQSGGGSNIISGGGASDVTNATGSSNPHNNMPPEVFLNAFIKL